MIFVDTKNGRTTTNFPPPLLMLLLDPGWIKIRIRDPGYPGSATLVNSNGREDLIHISWRYNEVGYIV